MLEHALDPNLQPSLPSVPCAQCGMALPVLNARCANCSAVTDMCIVTGALLSVLDCKLDSCAGAPLGPGEAWRPPSLRGVVANRAAWEQVVARTHRNPVTGKPM